MAKTYNVTIKKHSGTAWDVIYPKTTIRQVTNLSSTLANMQSDIDDALGDIGSALDAILGV